MHLVNKEYKTQIERKLILGLISRDYNLDEKETRPGSRNLQEQVTNTVQEEQTNYIVDQNSASQSESHLEESINAIHEEVETLAYNSNVGVKPAEIYADILKDKKN